MEKQKLQLIYDGDCFFCRQFGHYAQLKKKYDLEVIDATTIPEQIQQLQEVGVDIEEGMLVRV
jgi:hypothetical protein